jgi:hypothetical protein
VVAPRAGVCITNHPEGEVAVACWRSPFPICSVLNILPRLLSICSRADAGAGVGPGEEVEFRVWKAATLKADPRLQQDWLLRCLQGGRARPLAACGIGCGLLPPAL